MVASPFEFWLDLSVRDSECYLLDKDSAPLKAYA